MTSATYAQSTPSTYQSQPFGGYGDGSGAFGPQTGRGGFGTEQLQQHQVVQQHIALRIAQQLIRHQVTQVLCQNPMIAQQVEYLRIAQEPLQVHPIVQLLAQQPMVQQVAQQAAQQLTQPAVLQFTQQLVGQLFGQQQSTSMPSGFGQQSQQFGQSPMMPQMQTSYGMLGSQLGRPQQPLW